MQGCTPGETEFSHQERSSAVGSSVAVIGGGIGGLAAAIRLQSAGFEVTIYEKNDRPGGKLAWRRTRGGYVDLGPTLLTMIPVFEDLFHAAGADLHEHLRLLRIDPTCRYLWSDGTRFDAWAERGRLLEETARVFPEDVVNLDRFLDDVARVYDATADIFLTRPFRGIREMFTLANLRLLPLLGRLGFTSTMHASLSRRFSDPKLIQLLGRFATYNGSSPYSAPATLNLIAHVELSLGSWYPEQGMGALAEAITDLARSIGVRIETGAEVTGVGLDRSGGTVRGIRVNDEKGTIPTDLLISNVDALQTWRMLLAPEGLRPPERLENETRSCSGFLVTAAVPKRGPQRQPNGLPEVHHTICFADDYRREFAQIFEQGVYPDEMTIYRSVPSASSPPLAETEHESWYLLVNVPSGRVPVDRDQYVAAIFSRLRAFGLEIDPVDVTVLGPEEIEERYGSPGGAIYGSSSNSLLSAFLRHGNRSRGVENLYFVGGSVHPGGGLPLVALSGKIVAELIRERHG